MVIEVILLALGVVRLVELLKRALPIPIISLYKILAAFVFSGLVTLFFTDGWLEFSLVTLSVWGLSSILHSVERLVTTLGDKQRVEVLLSQTSGRRPRVF